MMTCTFTNFSAEKINTLFVKYNIEPIEGSTENVNIFLLLM